jgi:PAS domain S-box-containing protein
MSFSMLIDEVLEERGNAVMVIARPADGEEAVMQTVNGPLARIMGRPAGDLAGVRLGTLKSLAGDPADWASLMTAVSNLAPLSLDFKLRVGDREVWFGFGLTFKTDARDHASYGIMIGRDITESRRRSMLENETQRMLASVFLRISVATAIVRADGGIFMANPAFQRLLGYDANAVVGLNVEALTSPDYADAPRSARAQQLLDGNSYQMRLEALTKTNTRIPVTLNASLLRDSPGQRLRVVTLIPDAGKRDPPFDEHTPLPSAPCGAEGQSVGEVRALSLDALRTAFGEAWERVQFRAMRIAEQIVKRRLHAADVFSRSEGNGFVIWFAAPGAACNAAVVSQIAREIRLQFLLEFGEEVAACVRSTVVHVDATLAACETPSSPNVPSPALLSRLQDERVTTARGTIRLLEELRGDAAADVRPVTDRAGTIKPIVMVDFIPDMRHRIAGLAASVPHEPEQRAELDLLRLDLAVRQLPRSRLNGSVLLAVSWPTLAVPECRHSLDDRLARIDPTARQRLMLAISGAPPLPSGKRWSDLTGPLQRQLGQVGLILSLIKGDTGAAQQAIVNNWPLSLVVIDGTEDVPVEPSAYFNLIAAARNRDMQVLIRCAAAADIPDWRELGATMFVTPG